MKDDDSQWLEDSSLNNRLYHRGQRLDRGRGRATVSRAQPFTIPPSDPLWSWTVESGPISIYAVHRGDDEVNVKRLAERVLEVVEHAAANSVPHGEDEEGNEIYPIFAGESDGGELCFDCGEALV